MTTVTPEIRDAELKALCERQRRGEIRMEILTVVKPAGWIVQYRDVPAKVENVIVDDPFGGTPW